jgi:hypothetical protein
MVPNPFSQETTPRRSRRITMEEGPENIITVDTILQPSRTPNNISNTLPNTPTTRKRKVDYSNLYNFGFQGPPLQSPKPIQLAKKARISNIAKLQEEAFQVTIIPNKSKEESNEDIPEKKKPNTSGKCAW